MQSTGWIELFRLIPEKERDKLLIMTAEGSEVFVSDLIRLEPEYVVVRGRMGGTSDTGLAFFVPYDRIVYVRFQKAVAEATLYGLYGLAPPEVKRAEARQASDAAEEEAGKEAAEEAAEQPAEGETPATGVKRQQLLERLRQRAGQGAGKRGRPGEAPLPPGFPTENGTAASFP